MFYEKVEALFDESINFEEVCRDEDSYRVLNVKLWAIV